MPSCSRLPSHDARKDLYRVCAIQLTNIDEVLNFNGVLPGLQQANPCSTLAKASGCLALSQTSFYPQCTKDSRCCHANISARLSSG
jgi:hypothetical protein